MKSNLTLTTISSILNMVKDGKLEHSNPLIFQEERESILTALVRGYDLGNITVTNKNDNGNTFVVDGGKRVNAIVEGFNGVCILTKAPYYDRVENRVVYLNYSCQNDPMFLYEHGKDFIPLKGFIDSDERLKYLRKVFKLNPGEERTTEDKDILRQFGDAMDYAMGYQIGVRSFDDIRENNLTIKEYRKKTHPYR